jgi:nucleoside recognition membrane protein YjiH
MNQNQGDKPQQTHQTIIIKQDKVESNGIGTAGFVLSLVSIFLGWIPILGWIIWVLGLILSFVGIFRRPKGLAIAGLVISLIGLIFLILVFGMIGVAAAAGA